MLRRITFLLAALILAAGTTTARDLNIVSDIAPINALLQAVTQGIQTPVTLIKSSVSPHDFALKPSDIRTIEQADVIFWLGPDATPALAKLLQSDRFADKAVNLAALDGVMQLGLRKAGVFSSDSAADGLDPHMWLAPENAKIWAKAMTGNLSSNDPQNAETYQANLANLVDAIDQAVGRIRTRFAQTPPVPYVQFHDAFQYFETSFGLSPLGAATSEDDESTSLGTIASLRQVLSAAPSTCVFVRDDIQAKRAAPLTDATGRKTGWLKPLGNGIADVETTYPALLDSLAKGYADCFALAR
ncbi:MAG: zinc ABC transporter substrate-binding protein [Rhodobacterales bacterium]|jgi:zinc transport system substrate-binding protein